MRRQFLGIDPGLGGGFAVVRGRSASVFSMPETEQGILDLIKEIDADHVMLEMIQSAIFGIKKSSMSKLYGSYMELKMALVAEAQEFELVTAKVWQAGLGIPKREKGMSRGEWKTFLKSKAQKLFPGVVMTLESCDALLIAEFCRRQHENQ